jgi:hypothetical protein
MLKYYTVTRLSKLSVIRIGNKVSLSLGDSIYFLVSNVTIDKLLNYRVVLNLTLTKV